MTIHMGTVRPGRLVYWMFIQTGRRSDPRLELYKTMQRWKKVKCGPAV